MNRRAASSFGANSALCLLSMAVLLRTTCADRLHRSHDDNYPPTIGHDDMCGNLNAQTGLDIQQVGGTGGKYLIMGGGQQIDGLRVAQHFGLID